MTETHVYVETFRGTVAPSDCDHLGHMNVQYYIRAVSDGMYSVMIHLGLTLDEIRRRRISFAAVRAQMEFHHELYSGDVIFLESALVRIGTKSATFRHRLKNAATLEVAMSAEFQCALLDLNERRAVVIPDDVRIAAEKYFRVLSTNV
ncbi:MAG TPA: thioesterase family protein [Acidobacteriota bacterium]|nr:thioesterase family protein [Acidobacteriota bacterium]